MRAANLAIVWLLLSCASRQTVEHTPPPPANTEPGTTPAPVQPTPVHCPPAVFERVQSADLTTPDTSQLFNAIAGESIECQVEALLVVAGRLDTTSHPLVIGDFCTAAATLSRFLSPDQRNTIQSAYLRFPYAESIHLQYFLGLRTNHIDLRDPLRGRIVENWNFSHPRKGAETWQYYLYLASLDEPGAYDKLAGKVARTVNGNDVANYLKSLAELDTDPARQILLRYAGDKRRADGPDGPDQPLSEIVLYLLGPSSAQPGK